MPIRYDDSLGALIRDMLRRRVAGTGPSDDIWDRIQADLEAEGAPARQRGICVNPTTRMPNLLCPGRTQSAEY